MAGELVLITGVSGFIGFRVLAETLAAGYRVRATVRRAAQIDIIKGTKSVQHYLKKLEIVVVPDIIVNGAFDEALKDAIFVIHVASPIAIASDDPQADIIDPAVKGTTTLLSSAAKTPTVKRVVITSTVLALLPLGQPTTRPVNETDVVPRPVSPYGEFLIAYINSKILAYYAIEDWAAANKVNFDIIKIMPSFVFGRNELITNAKDLVTSGSNRHIMEVLMGSKGAFPLPANSVHVEDVAVAHVKSLDPAVSGNQSFALAASVEGFVWDDATEIVGRNFPVVAETGLMPLNGTQPTLKCEVDATKAKTELGMKFKSYEEQVKSLVGQYLELSGDR